MKSSLLAISLSFLANFAQASDYILSADEIAKLGPHTAVDYIQKLHLAVSRIEMRQKDVTFALHQSRPTSLFFAEAEAAMLRTCLIAG